jgi:hypothetical protein
MAGSTASPSGCEIHGGRELEVGFSPPPPLSLSLSFGVRDGNGVRRWSGGGMRRPLITPALRSTTGAVSSPSGGEIHSGRDGLSLHLRDPWQA